MFDGKDERNCVGLMGVGVCERNIEVSDRECKKLHCLITPNVWSPLLIYDDPLTH